MLFFFKKKQLRREAGMNMEEEEMMALAEVSFAEEYLRQIELINLKFSEKVRVFKRAKFSKKKQHFFVRFIRRSPPTNRAHL